MQKFFEGNTYPPDDGKVDLTAVYQEDMIKGYWDDPRQVKWKPATIQDLDTRIIGGMGAQLSYGATWVYAPAATDIEADFLGHSQTNLRWTLNGQPLDVGKCADDHQMSRQVAAKTITLQPGWNQFMFRGYCWGYPPFRAGLILNGPPEKLWKLQLSATPPVNP